jgi:hypothetical protein
MFVHLSTDILISIYDLLYFSEMKLDNCITTEMLQDKLFRENLSCNYNAATYLLENPDIIDWFWLTTNKNPRIIEYIYNNLHKITNIYSLCENPNTVEILYTMKADELKMFHLLQNKNENVKNIIINNIDKINENLLIETNSPYYDIIPNNFEEKIKWYCKGYVMTKTYEELKNNLHNINWSILSKINSDDCVRILEENPDKIDWDEICLNKNHKVINIINNNLDKINWSLLCNNKNAYDILKNNKDKFRTTLCLNQNEKIFNELTKEYIINNKYHNSDKNKLLPNIILPSYVLARNKNIFVIDKEKTNLKKTKFISFINNFTINNQYKNHQK